ncbi:hypothetical protein VTL71DRAFT_594 [Oculimacula yallundae]|uniref:Uncharacterized protein n=1 Tax=Oculimacula yallundae TaxID=86028 RepID=A0ABR4D1K0_9HELO
MKMIPTRFWQAKTPVEIPVRSKSVPGKQSMQVPLSSCISISTSCLIVATLDASHSEADHEKTNAERYALLKEQLSISAGTNISQIIWLYKNIRYQDMMYAPIDSALAAFIDVVPKEHWNKKHPGPLWDTYMAYEIADYFKGKSSEKLDELAASFKFEKFVQRKELNEILLMDALRGEAL